jgi:hypothetical protein
MTTTITHPATPANSIAELITAFQADNNLTDDDMAAQLGYAKGSVIAMIKRGAMSLPLIKVIELAAIMEIDEELVLELALGDRDPTLLMLFQRIKARPQVTPPEQRLLEHCRKLAADRKWAPVVFDGKDIIALVVG